MTEEVLQLHRDMAKDLRTAKVIAFDTESEDFLATPYRVSFATEKGFYSCGIGMKNYHGFGFVVKDSFVKEILSRSDVKIVMHNAKYDKKTVKLWLDIDIHDFEDTMLIAHLLNENERKGLKDVAQRYLGVKNWDVSKATKQGKALIQNSVEILPDVKPKVKLKNKIKKITAELNELSEEECCPYLVKQYNDLLYKLNCSDEEWKELVEQSKKEHEDETKRLLTDVWEQEVNYSALDAKYTLDLWNMLYPIIKEEQLQFVYEKIEKPLVNVLVDMELNGVPIDLELLKEIEVESKQEMKELEIKLRETFGDINFASPKQLSKAIFEDAGIDPIEPRSAKTGEYSTRAEILHILAKEHEPIKWILRHRELSKLVSTYMYGVDRLHSDFNQVATTTGRFSSSKPNLQQLPRSGKIRKCFIPEKGDKLIICDLSQVELRLTAFYSKDKEMLKCYAEDIDIHSRTAIASFNLKCSVDEVKKKYPEKRTYAKIVNFGLIYGMSPRTLSEALKVPLDVAQKAYNGYFRTYSGVKPFMESVKGVGKRRGYVKSFSGRRRRCKELYEAARFPSMVTADMHRTLAYQEREVANFVIQGTGADIMKMAMVNMYPELKKLGAKMLMTIHDEIVVSCPEDKVEEGARIIKYCMENAFPKINETVPIIAEPVICDNWGEGQ